MTELENKIFINYLEKEYYFTHEDLKKIMIYYVEKYGNDFIDKFIFDKLDRQEIYEYALKYSVNQEPEIIYSINQKRK